MVQSVVVFRLQLASRELAVSYPNRIMEVSSSLVLEICRFIVLCHFNAEALTPRAR